jgi:hypothetical protein
MGDSLHSLQSLLQKFTKQIEDTREEKHRIITICKEVCGITFQPSEVEMEGGVLRIQSHPAKRQVLFMKKLDILHALQEHGFHMIRDIR